MADSKTTKKSTSQKSTGKASTNTKQSNKKTPPKKTTGGQSGASTRSATLRTELKKFAGESYETSELLRGALIVVEREGADAVRAAVMALVASKIPLAGNELAKSAADPLIRQLTDDYKKLNAADRKAVRGVINWLTGAIEVDSRTTNDLVRTLSASQPVEATALSTPPPPEPRLEALAQGFVLPSKG
jgi:hypothetical protein